MRDFSGRSETWTRKKFKRVKRFLEYIGSSKEFFFLITDLQNKHALFNNNKTSLLTSSHQQ